MVKANKISIRLSYITPTFRTVIARVRQNQRISKIPIAGGKRKLRYNAAYPISPPYLPGVDMLHASTCDVPTCMAPCGSAQPITPQGSPGVGTEQDLMKPGK